MAKCEFQATRDQICQSYLEGKQRENEKSERLSLEGSGLHEKRDRQAQKKQTEAHSCSLLLLVCVSFYVVLSAPFLYACLSGWFLLLCVYLCSSLYVCLFARFSLEPLPSLSSFSLSVCLSLCLCLFLVFHSRSWWFLLCFSHSNQSTTLPSSQRQCNNHNNKNHPDRQA